MIHSACHKMAWSFKHYPKTNLGVLVGLELTTISITHTAIISSGIHVPAQFALAFALSRPFRRIRLPMELAGAAMLVKLFPDLSVVRPSTLIDSLTIKEQQQQQHPLLDRLRSNRVGKFALAVGDAIDSYGLAYFIAARWTGVIWVSTIYAALESKVVNIDQFLAWSGTAEIGSVLATWAAAVVTSSAIYPLSIYIGSAILAPPLGRSLSRIYRKNTIKYK
jgi:hypothetical protein